MKRLICFFITLSTILFSGCWSGKEVNNLAITACIGIDITENGYLVSEQIINPKSMSSKKSTTESPVTVYTAEGIDLASIIRSFSTQSPRKIYNAHLRMVILGQKLVEYGIKDVLDYFARSNEYRTDFYFAIAKNATAKEVLNLLTPTDSIPGVSMYNSLKLSDKEWAPTKAIKILELINSIIADGKNPVLTGIEFSEDKFIPNSTDQLKYNSGIKKLQYSSLGVLRKDKFVGWLNDNESKGYKYITGEVQGTVGYAYYEEKAKITFDVIRENSAIQVSLVDGKPVIDVKIDVKANVSAVEGDFDVSKEENKGILNEIGEKKITSLCEQSLNKAQQQLKTDIFGFGEAIHRTYPKLWKNIKDNWNDEFVDLKVNITVKATTIQTGQITKSFFIKEKD